jgi:acetyl-CoA synthetase
MFKANFNLVGLMLDFPNIDECDIVEWEMIVDKFLLSSKEKYKYAAIITSLPETLPKHMRDKCLKSGVVPLQGLRESLYAISCSILTGQAWSKSNIIKVFKSNYKIQSLKKTYSEYQSKKILKNYGIKIPKSILSNHRRAIIDSKKIGFPVVIKINSSQIFHKTEIQGVITNINSETEVKKSLKHISKLEKEILIEKMIQDQVTEMIIGIKIDNQFGPVIVVGAGGIYTELINDSVTLLLPLKKSIVLNAIHELKICKLLKGYRGNPKGDIEAVVQTIMKLGKFAEKNASRLIEVDINPLIVRPKGKGVIAADALIHYLEDIK